MNILALDTSTEACSAALLSAGDIIERRALAPRRHADLIMSMIAAVMAEAGMAATQLDAVAFGRGPGAFTGVRIATGVVQGIAFAADLPVVPISTLAAIAHATLHEHGVKRVAVAIDARMDEVYWGNYQATPDGGVVLLGQERVCPPAAVTLAGGDEWFGAGSGWATHTDALRLLGVKDWRSDCYPWARDIVLLGALAYARGEAVAAEQALPVYLRDAVAQKATNPGLSQPWRPLPKRKP